MQTNKLFYTIYIIELYVVTRLKNPKKCLLDILV